MLFFRSIVLFTTTITTLLAIISPPNEQFDQFANLFNDWRQLREHEANGTGLTPGWPQFDCDTSHHPVPPTTSVHQLHPSNIGVIAALGDSLSVAQAATATSLSEILQPNRGLNFVTGADVRLDEQATLYNIFSKFSNATLKGGSSQRVRKFYDFNFAESGAVSGDLPAQARRLAESIRHKLGERNDDTWKFINIFIGHNDACKMCQNQTHLSIENFGSALRSTLSIIKSEIPNVFINILPPIDIHLLSFTHQLSPFCTKAHTILCPCLSTTTTNYHTQFVSQLEQVVHEFEGNDRQVAIVSRPVDHLVSTRPSIAWFALDCFHFSPFAHDAVAKHVWVGLLGGGATCPPPACPYLRTPKTVCGEETRRSLAIEMESTWNTPPSVVIIIGISLTVLFALIAATSHLRRRSRGSEEEHYALLDLNDNIF